MIDQCQDPRPPVLLLSRVVPDALGATSPARAWQMLRRLAQCHEVDLACVADRPAHLAQWRQVATFTRDVTVAHADRRRKDIVASLWKAIIPWAQDRDYAAVFCADAALWPIARIARAQRVACDLAMRPSAALRRSAERRSPWAWRRAMRQVEQLLETERTAAREADVLTLAGFDDVARLGSNRPAVQCGMFPTGVPEGVLVVQSALDLSIIDTTQMNEMTVRDTAPLNLVMHSDWSRSHIRLWARSFPRRADRLFKRNARQVTIATTQGLTPAMTIQTIAQADAVVTQGDVTSALWAMALGKAVVTTGSVARAVGAISGKHLLTTQRDEEDALRCQELLPDVARRSMLGRNAAALVRTKHALDPSAGLWLGGQSTTEPVQAARTAVAAA